MKVVVFFLVAVAGACSPNGGVPANVIVKVANTMAQTGDFAWQTGGVFGTPLLASTGSEPIGGCAVYMRTFDGRTTKLDITSGNQVLHVDLGANPGSQAERDFVIGPRAITEVNPADLPATPCG